MNAIQFIKDQGVEKAREVVEGAPDGTTGFRVLDNSKGYGYAKVNHHGVYWDKHGKWKTITICEQQTVESFKATLIDLSDLQRLVESLDLIKFYGGIERAKLLLTMGTCLADRPPHAREVQLKQAIADYEAIYSGAEQ